MIGPTGSRSTRGVGPALETGSAGSGRRARGGPLRCRAGGLVKAVVLARGLGTRMKAGDAGAGLSAAESTAADTGVKSLVPLGDERPFLDYVLSALADAGCSQIALVIGPEHEAIRDRYTRAAPPRRFRIAFAVQEQPRGTGDALLAAESFAAGDEFLMVNSDNYYPVTALRALVEMGRPGTVLFSPEGMARGSNIEPARIMAFALGTIGPDGCLDALIEKPDAAALARLGSARHVSMNCWRFPTAIFAACRTLTPSSRGELELTDAIMKLIASGFRFMVRFSDEGVLDLSKRGDIPSVKRGLRGARVDL
jgi:dTDP-glucose pyrophosphorylase